jgi:hypothetical protein
MVRSILRDASAKDVALEIAPAEREGAIEVKTTVQSVGLRRTSMLEPLELALVRYMLARHAGKALSEADPDRLRIEGALHRLSGAPTETADNAIDRELCSGEPA